MTVAMCSGDRILDLLCCHAGEIDEAVLRKTVAGFTGDAVFATKGLKGPEYERAYKTNERFRLAAEQARIALGRHRSEHRC